MKFKVNILASQNMHLDIMTMFGKKWDFLGLRASDDKDSPVKLENRAVFLFGRALVYVSTEHPKCQC